MITFENRYALLWVVANIPGVNKLEAELIKSIRKKLEAKDTEMPPVPELMQAQWDWNTEEAGKNEVVFEQSEKLFLRLALEGLWEQKRVPGALSSMMLNLDLVLKE